MIHQKKTKIRQNFFRYKLWTGCILVVLWIGGCAGPSHQPKNEPLPPPEHATPLAAQLILEGNQRFAEHRWTAARGKYEEAIQAQPKLAEAHYNLGLALYRKGPVEAARPYFIEAATLAPGHPVIWNSPPFRKYGTVEPSAPEGVSDDDHGHQH